MLPISGNSLLGLSLVEGSSACSIIGAGTLLTENAWMTSAKPPTSVSCLLSLGASCSRPSLEKPLCMQEIACLRNCLMDLLAG